MPVAKTRKRRRKKSILQRLHYKRLIGLLIIFVLIIISITSVFQFFVGSTKNTPTTQKAQPAQPAQATPKTPQSRFAQVKQENAMLKIPVLMYHDVKDIPSSTDGNVIPQKDFEAQLKWLKDNGFTTITMQEFIDAYQRKIFLPKKSVLITLDDGFKSIKTIVNPLLKKYDLRATSFIIGSYINRPEWHLTKNEIQEIARDGFIDFESHTYDLHKDGSVRGIINETPVADIVSDIRQNEAIIGHQTRAFCYPFGAFSEHSIEALKQANVPFAFAIHSGNSTWVQLNETKTSQAGDVQNPLSLPRVRINGDISLETFIDLVSE